MLAGINWKEVGTLFPLEGQSGTRGHIISVRGRDGEKLFLSKGREPVELTAPECSECRDIQ